ncbi:HAD-IA family hydrolase [Pelagibius sp. Alg239-R121]|uniref:HAD-IA family hydrolase n=1 Tax=Pelagibius sp. Alg239-R121 TaxID=2993448 RepID=UPI0024A6ACA2|nr:HAD-IA family hydrolase [Pelagibius sp. Alg239-R121]
MTEKSKALVLDFGGVISRTLFETQPQNERALGLPEGTLTWRGPFAPESDPLWQSMQAEEISERDYWLTRTKEVGRMLGEDWTSMVQFVQRARGADPASAIRPEALSAITAAQAAGCRLAILSNELDLFYGVDFREKLPFMADFDVIVDATYTKILKPDPQAYETCIRRLGLTADDCVFVDDQLRNIEGALAVGMQCVHFDVRTPGKSYAAALALLGLKQTEAIDA